MPLYNVIGTERFDEESNTVREIYEGRFLGILVVRKEFIHPVEEKRARKSVFERIEPFQRLKSH